MFDRISIHYNGEAFAGSRYLRRGEAGVYQSIFYLGHCRSDAAVYPRFASDDECMNREAKRMLSELVSEATARGEADPVVS
jgi:hypothetical protein